MKLDEEIVEKFRTVPLFQSIGKVSDCEWVGLPCQQIESLPLMLENIMSNSWKNVGTEAQGDLTGFLAKNHPSIYGQFWNKLARESLKVLDSKFKSILEAQVSRLKFPVEITRIVMLDFNRIHLYFSYRKIVEKLPDFYQYIFSVYEKGHIPCGWDYSGKSWPRGKLMYF